MQIGLSSIVGDGFGFGSFVFGEVPSGGGVPSFGTYLYTEYSYPYAVSQGGAYYPNVDTINYPIETCDVDRVADGSGGSFIDWTTATNVQPLAQDVLICYESVAMQGGTQVEVPSGSSTYWYYGEYPERIVYSDGAGSWYFMPNENGTFDPYDYGTYITDDGMDGFYWVGDGTYFTEPLV
jgi:hypothetical protein